MFLQLFSFGIYTIINIYYWELGPSTATCDSSGRMAHTMGFCWKHRERSPPRLGTWFLKKKNVVIMLFFFSFFFFFFFGAIIAGRHKPRLSAAGVCSSDDLQAIKTNERAHKIFSRRGEVWHKNRGGSSPCITSAAPSELTLILRSTQPGKSK